MGTQSALRPVKVVWIDSKAWPEWENAEVAVETAQKNPLTCVTVGVLVSDEEDRIILAQSFSYNGPDVYNMAGVLAIPKGVIQSMYELGKGRSIWVEVKKK